MLICLENILDRTEVKAVGELLKKKDLFESGEVTAGTRARRMKSNLHGRTSAAEISGVTEKIRSVLNKNKLFNNIAIPAKIGRILISRYEAGMKYDVHYDEPFIDRLRTDLSFTVFLTDPDTYVGGELEIDSPSGAQAIKLPAGCAVIYPSDRLHAVLPITDGTRLTAVAWVQSRIRSSEQRQLLFELADTTTRLETSGAQTSEITSLKHLRNNLLRMWSEGGFEYRIVNSNPLDQKVVPLLLGSLQVESH